MFARMTMNGMGVFEGRQRRTGEGQTPMEGKKAKKAKGPVAFTSLRTKRQSSQLISINDQYPSRYTQQPVLKEESVMTPEGMKKQGIFELRSGDVSVFGPGDEAFTPGETQPFPADVPEDIRAYTDPYGSSLGQIDINKILSSAGGSGGILNTIVGAAPAVYSAIQQAKDAKKLLKAAAPPATSAIYYPPPPASTFPWKWVGIAGGGVLVLGVVGYFLLRK